MKKLLFMVFVIILFSCKKEETKTKLAQVNDKFLYLEDVAGLLPDDVTGEDSIIIIKNKIDLWVRKQSILKRAELNLSDEQKDTCLSLNCQFLLPRVHFWFCDYHKKEIFNPGRAGCSMGLRELSSCSSGLYKNQQDSNPIH